MSKTENTKKKVLSFLAIAPVVEVAVKRAGVARATYYRWRKSDQQFAEAADEAIEQSCHLVNDLAESQLISEIKAKNMTAIMFWLKHRHAGYRNKLELSGKVETSAENLSEEQEVIVKQALLNAGLISKETNI